MVPAFFACPRRSCSASAVSTLLLLVQVALALPRVDAATVSSRILIDAKGENGGDSFGSSIAGAGDMNGDGFDDVIIGANYYPSVSGYGRAYVFLGGPGAESIADLVIPAPQGTSLQWFGYSVASLGDLNGDGYSDVIVGALYSATFGEAFIYFGGASLHSAPDLTLTGENPCSVCNSFFGASVAGAGDVNGDGFKDVIVGSPLYSTNSKSQCGQLSVFYGGPALDAVPDLRLDGEADGDQLGSQVGSAGDMNGDGYADLFGSAPNNDATFTDAGAVYVWFGGPTPDAVPDIVIQGGSQNARIGFAVAGAGDVNGDGYSDLILNATSRTEVHYGGSSPDAIPDVVFARRGSVAGAGDVNGDGRADFVVGDPTDDTGGTDAGRVSVYFGGSGLDTLEDLHFTGDQPDRRLGKKVAVGGNVDGSGPVDLIAGARENAMFDRGRVYVFANYAYRMLAPNGAEQWVGGQTASVDWEGPDPADLELSADGGASWAALATNVGGTTLNHYDVMAPMLNTISARVRVHPASEIPSSLNSDVSDAGFEISSTTGVGGERSAGLDFVGAQPNPAWNQVHLVMTLEHAAFVRIGIYDLVGHEVAQPLEMVQPAGRQVFTWTPDDLPSGLYYLRARLGHREQVRKLVWLGRR
jgi:hypothetical protein